MTDRHDEAHVAPTATSSGSVSQRNVARQRRGVRQQPTAPRRANSQHGEEVRAHAPQGSHSDGESRYRPDPAGAQQKPLKVRVELRLVDGPEGRKLRARQAAAIREALRWFAEHGGREQTDPISQEPSGE
jgi:hypothetical protein